jgi:D-alanyl-D-alanine dipeptidase
MEKQELDLVDARAFGIKGINFYWTNRDRYNISQAELADAGVFDDGVYVHRDLIEPLQRVQQKLQEQGFDLMIKDAYRSPELYKLIFDKRSQMANGNTFLLNLERMPHATGRTVDTTLLAYKTGEELKLRNNALDPEGGYKIGFYASRPDEQSQEYDRLQQIMLTTMLAEGFKLGLKEEFWHFELP